jgi:hypothetical protein
MAYICSYINYQNIFSYFHETLTNTFLFAFLYFNDESGENYLFDLLA